MNICSPEQLILQDDPNFLPDFNLMPVDLDQLDFDITTLGGSQRETLSPYGSQQRLVSPQYVGGLILPQSDSPFGTGAVGNLGSFGIRGDSGPGSGIGARYKHAMLLDDDLGLSLDLDGDVPMTKAGSQSEPAAFINVGGNTGLGSVSPLMKQDLRPHDNQNAKVRVIPFAHRSKTDMFIVRRC